MRESEFNSVIEAAIHGHGPSDQWTETQRSHYDQLVHLVTSMRGQRSLSEDTILSAQGLFARQQKKRLALTSLFFGSPSVALRGQTLQVIEAEAEDVQIRIQWDPGQSIRGTISNGAWTVSSEDGLHETTVDSGRFFLTEFSGDSVLFRGEDREILVPLKE